MTTIAYRDKTLAADSKISDYDSMSATYMRKIFKITVSEYNKQSETLNDNSYLVGIVGDMYAGLRFIKWLQTKNEGDKEFLQGLTDDYFFEAITINEDGEVDLYNNFLEPLRLGKTNFYALGSGSKIAMALLDYGASLEDTIKYAKKYDMNTGGDTHIVSFNS